MTIIDNVKKKLAQAEHLIEEAAGEAQDTTTQATAAAPSLEETLLEAARIGAEARRAAEAKK